MSYNAPYHLHCIWVQKPVEGDTDSSNTRNNAYADTAMLLNLCSMKQYFQRGLELTVKILECKIVQIISSYTRHKYNK
jgi:hypothetical protein